MQPATRAPARFREAPSGVIDFDNAPHSRAANRARPHSPWGPARLAFSAYTKVHLVIVQEAVTGLAVKADHACRACRVRGWWQPPSKSLRARAPQPIVHTARGLCHQASVMTIRLGVPTPHPAVTTIMFGGSAHLRFVPLRWLEDGNEAKK